MSPYLVCPTDGEVPFLVNDLEEVFNYLATEEYYVVDFDTQRLIWLPGSDQTTELILK